MSGVLGRNIPHDSAKGHVSGESRYIDDTPFAKNELIVDFVGSPVAHGKLKSIDYSEALKVPGIAGAFTVKDIDGHNVFGPILQDEVLLADDAVEFVGQPIVILAGESRRALKKAKKLIKLEIDELPPVLTIEEAIAKPQYISDTKTIQRGDLEKGFAEADHVIEGEFYNAGQEHFYLESQASIAYPGEHNTLKVKSSTQHTSEVQAVIAEVLGLGFNQVVVETKRMRGAFGGKECQATHFAVMASLVAHKLKRPARIALDVDTDMKVTGKRHAFKNQYKIGFTNEGVITAFDVHLYSNGGYANDLSTAVMGRAMCHAENAYFIPNVKIQGTVCKTNLPPNTAFRGFGGPQGMLNIENIMQDIAKFLDKDAFEIRRVNCYGVDDRNVTPYGETFNNNCLPQTFDRLAKEADYKNRLKAIEDFNAKSKTRLKGIALTPIKFGISFNTKFLNQATALVNIYLDGTVQVSTGATEMGQGVNTKIQQLVADEFSIPVETVRVMTTSTEKSNNTSATAASSSSDLNGSAAAAACKLLRERIQAFAEKHFADKNIAWDENGIGPKGKQLPFANIVKLAHLDRVNLGERGFYKTPGLSFDWATGSGNPFLYYTTGCAVSEVLIDRFTGELKVTRADILMDIGKSMNPGIDRGQITGAFIQGMGWLTTEELKYADNGELLSHSPTTYKIPNVQDLPEIFNVNWIENDGNTVNLRASKAVGEPPLMLAISVWAAVKHALSCVPGDQPVTLHAPATNEEILMRLTALTQKAPAKV